MYVHTQYPYLDTKGCKWPSDYILCKQKILSIPAELGHYLGDCVE